MGFDLDQLLPYAAPKYVYIRNAKLGVLKLFFMFMIFLYVVVYEIIMTCDHLIPHHASGFGKISMIHPVDNCDPLKEDCEAMYDNIDKLPYCKQYAGEKKASKRVLKDAPEDDMPKDDMPKDDMPKGDDEPKDEEEDGKESGEGPTVGSWLSRQKTCRYFDEIRLTWGGTIPDEIFVPMRYVEYSQELSPECYDPVTGTTKGDQGGKSRFSCHKAWHTVGEKDFFVADIGNFALHLESSFNAPRANLYGVSEDFQGFMASCPTNHPKDIMKNCKRMKIPNSKGDVAAEDLIGLVDPESMGVTSLQTTKDGDDVITLDDLLKLTPMAQGHDLEDSVLDVALPASMGHPHKSVREAGGTLMLSVDYENNGYWRPNLPGLGQIKPVTYSYRTFFMPQKENLKYEVENNHHDPLKRKVKTWHGLTIRMEFNGQLVAFTWAALLTALTTGLVLVTSASTIVQMLALYVLPMKEKYQLLLYQNSEDFSDYVQLKKGAKDAKSLESKFAPGDLLLRKMGQDCEASSEFSKEELMRLFCTIEMRLNRIDGMDPDMVFLAGDEPDVRNYNIGNFKRDFYKTQLDDLSKMSYDVQLTEPAGLRKPVQKPAYASYEPIGSRA